MRIKCFSGWLGCLLLVMVSARAEKVCDFSFPQRDWPGGWPVTFGLPVEQGRVQEAKGLYVVDAAGNELLLQVKVNARWPDGSLKWILLDSISNTAGAHSLRHSPERTAESTTTALAESREGGLIALTTGGIRLELPTSGPLWRYWQGDEEGQADLQLLLQTEAPGPTQEENWLLPAGENKPTRSLSSAADRERLVLLEENGPVRATVKISGWFTAEDGSKAYQYIVRLTAWRDLPQLKAQVTFVATEEVNTHFLRGLELRLQRVSDSARVGAISRTLTGDAALSLAVYGSPRFYHLTSYRERQAPVGTLSWLQGGTWQELSSSESIPEYFQSGRLTAVVKDFARLFPKEFSADAAGCSFHIWPERSGMVLDLRRREGQRPEYHDYQNPAGGMGVAKTHELYLSWGTAAPEQFARLVNTGLYPEVAPQYYRQTGAAGEYLVRMPEHFPRLEAAIAFFFKYLHQQCRAGRFEGMIDWGDIPLMTHGQTDHKGDSHPESSPFRGYTGWNNNDFGLAHGFWLQYLRTGEPGILADAITTTWHVIDVDTVHYMPGRPEMVGLGRRHDQQHWGSGISYGYAIDSALYMYLLCGEQRALEVLKETADSSFYYGRYITVRLWELTGEEKYRQKAERDLQADINLDRAYPFSHNDFRVNSFDSPGYLFYDQILPNELLREGVIKAAEALYKRYSSPYLPKGYPPYGILALAHKYAPTAENTEILARVLLQLRRNAPSDPAVLAISPTAPMAEYDRINREHTRFTNTSVFSLMFVTALPYCLERLRLAGVKEEDCLDYQYDWVEPESFSEVLETAKIKPSSYPQHRNGWSIKVQNTSFADWYAAGTFSLTGKEKWRKAVLRYKLYEDGRLLGPVSSAHWLIMVNGTYGWSHRGGNILFSVPDNTNPAENKREYRLVYTSAEDWRWQDQPSFEEVLPADKIYPYPDLRTVSGEWCCSLQNPSPDPVCVYPEPPELQGLYQESLQRHLFSEDGKALPDWRRSQNLIIFKTSDASDPRQNGRQYRLKYTSGQP